MNINEVYLATVDGSLGFEPRRKTRIRVGSASKHFRELDRTDDVMTVRCRWQRPRRRDLELWPSRPRSLVNAAGSGGRRAGGGVAARALFEGIYPVTDSRSATAARSAGRAAGGSLSHVAAVRVVVRRLVSPPEVAGQSSRRWRHFRSLRDVVVVFLADAVGVRPERTAVRATHAPHPAVMSPAELVVYHVTQRAGTGHRVIVSGVVSGRRLVLGLVHAVAVVAHARRRFLVPPEETLETLRRRLFATSSGRRRLRSRALPVFIWLRHIGRLCTRNNSNNFRPRIGNLCYPLSAAMNEWASMQFINGTSERNRPFSTMTAWWPKRDTI